MAHDLRNSPVLELNVREWGVGDRRALLVHGINSSAATWWRVAGWLADAHGFAVAAPDLRGHGDSPRGDEYSVAEYAADLLALGREWDLVVGHSLGGLIAAYAAQDSEWARRLVLIDPALDIDDELYDEVLDGNLREVENAPDAAHFQRDNPLWHPEDARIKAEAVRQASPTMTERTLVGNAPWHYADLLTTLAVPTLVLGADPASGAIFEPELGEAAAAANRNVTYELIEGTGHSIHRDDPDAVAAAIGTALSE